MLTKLEKQLEKRFKTTAASRGIFSFKLVLLNRRGWPDQTIMKNGRVAFVEFKRPDGRGKLSAPQKKLKVILQGLGFTYFVCDSDKQFTDIFASVD